MKIQRVFENSEIVILNKPIGLSSDTDYSSDESLLNWAKEEINSECRLIHRLDKETSGLIAVAKSKSSASRFMSYFENRRVKKHYVGVLCGQLKVKNGIWNNPLTESATGRTQIAGNGKLVQCHTDFTVLDQAQYFALVQFELHTGRTHQIRRHAALNGHAIYGDMRYGNENYFNKMFERYKVNRMCLHSSLLEFLDEGIEVSVPTPEEFLKLTSS